jgi:hypothetical protein
MSPSHTVSVNPHDQASRERIQYDSKAAALVGRRVVEARYWDVHNFADEPSTWDYHDWHRAVMGVELRTDRGPSCVLWTSTFFPYGVEVFQTPMSEHIFTGEEGPESWDVSESGRWRDRLNSPVANVQTFWEPRLTAPTGRRCHRRCVRHLGLAVHDGSVRRRTPCSGRDVAGWRRGDGRAHTTARGNRAGHFIVSDDVERSVRQQQRRFAGAGAHARTPD